MGGIVCVLIGVMAGRLWRAPVDDAPSATTAERTQSIPSLRLAARPAQPSPPAAEQAAQDARANRRASTRVADLQNQIDTLSREKDQIQQQLTDFLNWLLTNYKGKYPLPENFMSRLRLSPVDEDFTLNPEVAELLKITPDEEQVINAAFDSTRLFLAEMESALMTISEEQADKVVVHIPAHREEGALIKEDLLLALEATLGTDRFDRFMDVAEEDLDANFIEFGERARTIIFEVVYPEEPDAPPMLAIKDGWIEQQGPDRKVVTATQFTVPELPEEYLAYIEWLQEQPASEPDMREF
jgi:hypothetical protein